MHEIVPLEDLLKVAENTGHQKLDTPNLQEAVERQFGPLPEYRRRYDESMQCRVTEYDRERGYVRFQTVVIPSKLDAFVKESHTLAGSIIEYQLLDRVTKDRVSRSAFFAKRRNGWLELIEADVYYSHGVIDTEYHTDYHGDACEPEHTSVKIFYNQSKDPQVLFPYTRLVEAHRFYNNPREIHVAHGTFEQLEKYYREQKEEFRKADEWDFQRYFPGVRLDLPQKGRNVLVYDGLEGLALAKEKPKKIDTLSLEEQKIINYRGAYLYQVRIDEKVSIMRDGLDEADKEAWRIVLFNQDNKTLDACIKGDWVHLNESLPATIEYT